MNITGDYLKQGSSCYIFVEKIYKVMYNKKYLTKWKDGKDESNRKIQRKNRRRKEGR